MKRAIIVLAIIALAFTATTAPASAATTDKGLVKSYCAKHYKGFSVKYVKEGAKVLDHRKGKKAVYIEAVKTKAKGGKIGKTKDGYTVKYNKKAKKGKKITVYMIYSPKTNAPDAVEAIVTQKKIRK